ncbi:hypothetical protein Taro_007932 [Colocasia esculenta]|uniref:Fatty acid hydroxylase domain-containing protein n=1 Tax=Colocasia esculenta TaxID=4460 RepID=A0A843TWV2_COLES|nr:hypothetical protein [Colocasia esculenta]
MGSPSFYPCRPFSLYGFCVPSPFHLSAIAPLLCSGVPGGGGGERPEREEHRSGELPSATTTQALVSLRHSQLVGSGVSILRSVPLTNQFRAYHEDNFILFVVNQIGVTMVSEGFTVDVTKPLVFQVGHLREAYEAWVHQPIVSKEGPRFFENSFFEHLTRTVWWVIPLVWLPVVCWFVSRSIMMGRTLPQVAILVVCGIFVWSLMEYGLHRFLFHIKTSSYWGNTVHYLLHGCHHKHPMDALRLVFPPAATAILCIPFWGLFNIVATPPTASALFGGGLLGYVIYDCIHYYLHHGRPSKDPVRNLKRFHLNHHFRIQNKAFGITSTLWDRIFGTLPPPSRASKKGD